jgi:hypothetical protein
MMRIMTAQGEMREIRYIQDTPIPAKVQGTMPVKEKASGFGESLCEEDELDQSCKSDEVLTTSLAPAVVNIKSIANAAIANSLTAAALSGAGSPAYSTDLLENAKAECRTYGLASGGGTGGGTGKDARTNRDRGGTAGKMQTGRGAGAFSCKSSPAIMHKEAFSASLSGNCLFDH